MNKMQLSVKQGDVLLESADALVCSANVFLNLSGGVGGEILHRYGPSMQEELHAYLRGRGLKFVNQGDVIRTNACGTSFTHVFHAVAVDGWYASSSAVVANVLKKAFTEAAALRVTSIAVVALGTGYGRLPFSEFAEGLQKAAKAVEPVIREIRLVVSHSHEASVVEKVLKSAATIL